MKFLPTGDVARFHAFALLFLVSILASTFIGALAFGITLALFAAICFFLTRPLATTQRRQAYALFGVFTLLGAAALAVVNLAFSPQQALGAVPFLVIGFAAIYAAVKLYVVSWEMECKVIGYSEGYAIVDVAPAVLAVIAPGVIAVKSGPVAKGKAKLVFKRSLFEPNPKPVRLDA